MTTVSEYLLECVPMLTQTQSFHRPHHSVGPSSDSHCLIPFDRREGMTTAEAARQADRTERTIRMWCRDHDIGRRIMGGPWIVSKVALAMLLSGDASALRAYLAGDRRSQVVVAYFTGEGLGHLVERWQTQAA